MGGHPWTVLGRTAGPLAGLIVAFVCLTACGDTGIDQPSPTAVQISPTVAQASPSPQPPPPAATAVTRPGATQADLGIKSSDCLLYSAASLEPVDAGDRGWLLIDGTHQVVLLDNKADADTALALARRHTAHCFIGRDNPRPNRNDYIIGYWTGSSGRQTPIAAQEDCIAYRTASLHIVDEGASGWLLTDGSSRMNVLDNQQDANNALKLAQQFTKQCFIGRNNNRPDRTAYIVQYWQ